MATQPITIRATGRVAKVSKARGLEQGLIWVEVYAPLDIDAYAQFVDLVAKNAGDVLAAAELQPELASKALDPIDSHGEAMLPDDLIKLAHGWMANSRKMDVMHDEAARDTLQAVESFVNTEEVASPLYADGAWVVVFKVAKGSPEWDKIEAGELDAVSLQTVVTKVPVIYDVTLRRPEAT